jgi:hypothetical protein
MSKLSTVFESLRFAGKASSLLIATAAVGMLVGLTLGVKKITRSLKRIAARFQKSRCNNCYERALQPYDIAGKPPSRHICENCGSAQYL